MEKCNLPIEIVLQISSYLEKCDKCGKYTLNKYNYCEIPMHERKRYAGKKNVNVIKDGFLILIEILYSFYKKFIK